MVYKMIKFHVSFLKQQKLESETPELNMENSVAVVSFTEENRELHLTIARTVASAFRIHPTYVGGLNNILNIELNSKVSLYLKCISYMLLHLIDL